MRTKCTCGARKAKKKAKLRTLMQGDRLLNLDNEYIVAQIEAHMFMLIALDDGNRWADGLRNLDMLTIKARQDGFTLKGVI